MVIKMKKDRSFCLWNNDSIETRWLRLKRYYSLNVTIYEMAPHAHSEMEIMYVTYGECEITCIDRQGNFCAQILKKEDYVIIDAGIFHSLSVRRDGFCRILNMEILLEQAAGDFRIGDLLQRSDGLKAFLKKDEDYSFLSDKNNEMLFLIEYIQHYNSSKLNKAESSLALNYYLAQFVLILARHSDAKEKGSKGNRYVKKVKEFLEQNYDSDIRISMIAEKLNVSEAYLQRLYKQTEGESIIRTLQRIRMEKASVLLTNSKLPVIDIAVSVGINSRQHFSYVFTKEFGCSPKDYRKMKGYSEMYEGFGKYNFKGH